MGLFSFIKPKAQKQKQSLSYFEKYIKGSVNINFNYSHQVTMIDNKLIRHEIEADSLDTKVLNNDIKLTLQHARAEGISVVVISYKGMKFDNLIADEIKPDYVSEFNNYVIYLNKSEIIDVKSQDGLARARLSAHLEYPAKLIANDNFGNQLTFLVNKDGQIKVFNDVSTDRIKFLGEYFGVIEYKGTPYFCYATLPLI